MFFFKSCFFNFDLKVKDFRKVFLGLGKAFAEQGGEDLVEEFNRVIESRRPPPVIPEGPQTHKGHLHPLAHTTQDDKHGIYARERTFYCRGCSTKINNEAANKWCCGCNYDLCAKCDQKYLLKHAHKLTVTSYGNKPEGYANGEFTCNTCRVCFKAEHSNYWCPEDNYDLCKACSKIHEDTHLLEPYEWPAEEVKEVIEEAPVPVVVEAPKPVVVEQPPPPK